MDYAALNAAVRAVCPCAMGARVVDEADRSTWTVALDESAPPPSPGDLAAARAVIAGWADPVPPRRAPLSALLDALSPAQRAAITADHDMRLEAEGPEHPGGVLPITNGKVIRAAADLGMTPDAWFALAGF